MCIFKSIIFGSEGVYDINGIPANFTSKGKGAAVFGESWFGYSVDLCLENSVVPVLSLGYLHVFIHEMGHAFAAQLQSLNPVVNVYTSSCRGDTQSGGNSKFIALSGPLAGMALEVVKLITAVALAILLPWPIGLPLSLFIGAGAVFWIFGEAMYALVGHGDWDLILSFSTQPLSERASLNEIEGIAAVGFEPTTHGL